ncbi:MAG: hypothetical protein NVS9B15_18110 [Acidobacteriaceae bacterium]
MQSIPFPNDGSTQETARPDPLQQDDLLQDELIKPQKDSTGKNGSPQPAKP